MRTSTLTVALLSALVVASAGTAGSLAASPLQPQESPTNNTTSGGDTATQNGPSVTFEDQESSGESLLVASTSLPRQGFVAIYDSSRSGNQTDQVIGASYLLEPGTSDNVRVQLDESINGSTSLTAVVHTDTNGNGEFDYVSSNGQEDAPLTPQGDRRIVDIAQVTVANAGGTNGTAATDTTAATTDDGAANATTGETATDGTSTEETTGNEASAEETTAEATTTDDAAATDAAGATDEANGTAANDANGSGDSGGSGAFGPGFGPVVAVVALLAAALFAARRRE